MKRDWEELTATSYYDTVVEIKEAFGERDTEEVIKGLDALLDSLAMNYEHGLRSQLVRLMMHIIKWKIQPEKRTGSWASPIFDARDTISYIQKKKPSLNRRFIEEELWEPCFRKAIRLAEDETGKENTVDSLTWEEVFNTEYRLLRS